MKYNTTTAAAHSHIFRRCRLPCPCPTHTFFGNDKAQSVTVVVDRVLWQMLSLTHTERLAPAPIYVAVSFNEHEHTPPEKNMKISRWCNACHPFYGSLIFLLLHKFSFFPVVVTSTSIAYYNNSGPFRFISFDSFVFRIPLCDTPSPSAFTFRLLHGERKSCCERVNIIYPRRRGSSEWINIIVIKRIWWEQKFYHRMHQDSTDYFMRT